MIQQWSTWLARLAERHSKLVLTAYSLLFLAVTGLLGATKLMDFDEIFTYYPARQATLGQVWSFFAEGLDVHTPMVALLVRASMAVFGDTHFALRLPMVLGYWLWGLAIYTFVSYRTSKLYGMAAMLLPPITSVYFYATEARPYGILLGVTAWGLVFWQRANSGSRRALWLSAWAAMLAFSVSLHYFAVLLWVPYGLAELVRTWQRRKVDWAVWAVLIASLFPLAVFFNMIQMARRNFISSIWSPPHLGDIENTYRTILTLAYAPLLITVIVWLLVSRGTIKPEGEPQPEPPLSERVLIGSLALMPFFAVPLMMLGGTFVVRYVLYTTTGFTIYLALAAYRRARGDEMVALAAVVCLGGWFVMKYPNMGRHQMAESRGLPFGQARPFADKVWTKAIEQRPELPVLINPAVFYLQFQHYSAPEVQQRTYYLISIADAMKYDGTDTGDRNLQFFRRRFPVQVPDYYEFTRANREFLLLAETTNPTWVVNKLLDDGAKLDLILRDQTYFLYHVSLDRR